MYLLPGEIKLQDALIEYCSTVAHKDYDEIEWQELQVIAKPVRDALALGQIKVICRASSGESREVAPELFAGSQLWDAAWDPTSTTFVQNNELWTGYLVVKKDFFDKLVRGVDDSSPEDVIERSYVPPILAFAVELAARFEITADYKFDRKAMQHAIFELAKQEAPELKISIDKSRYIATFIGHPDHESGGAHKSKAGARDPDPSKSFEGRTYPRPKAKR